MSLFVVYRGLDNRSRGFLDVPYNAGEWFKARVRITNIAGGKVKCKAWFNDSTSTTLIDSGQITCGGQKIQRHSQALVKAAFSE
jgi:hypothetical protein